MPHPGSDTFSRLLRSPSFELLLPLLAFVYLHYAFVSVYAVPSLTWDTFIPYMAQGIYKYRVLGPDVVVWLQSALPASIRSVLAAHPDEIALGVHLDLDLYNIIFVVNFVAFVGTLVIGRRMLRSCLPDNYRSLYWVLTGCVLASTSALTPYDFPAYLFLVATIASLEFRRSSIAYPALITLTVLGTLTRETQALVIPYAISTLIAASPDRARVMVPRIVVIAAAFGTTYVALRAKLGWNHGVVQEITFGWQGVLSAFGVVVAVLVMALVYLAAAGCAPSLFARRRLVVLYALALPYWSIVILAGFYFELRLVIPLTIVHAAAVVNRRGVEPQSQEGTRKTSVASSDR